MNKFCTLSPSIWKWKVFDKFSEAKCNCYFGMLGEFIKIKGNVTVVFQCIDHHFSYTHECETWKQTDDECSNCPVNVTLNFCPTLVTSSTSVKTSVKNSWHTSGIKCVWACSRDEYQTHFTVIIQTKLLVLHKTDAKETPNTAASFPHFIDTSFLGFEVFLNHIFCLRLLAIILQTEKAR